MSMSFGEREGLKTPRPRIVLPIQESSRPGIGYKQTICCAGQLAFHVSYKTLPIEADVQRNGASSGLSFLSAQLRITRLSLKGVHNEQSTKLFLLSSATTPFGSWRNTCIPQPNTNRRRCSDLRRAKWQRRFNLSGQSDAGPIDLCPTFVRLRRHFGQISPYRGRTRTKAEADLTIYRFR